MSDYNSEYLSPDRRRRARRGGDRSHRSHRHESGADKIDYYGPQAIAIRRSRPREEYALQRVPEARSDVSSEVEQEYDYRDQRRGGRRRNDRRRHGDHIHTGIIAGLVFLVASFLFCWVGNDDSSDDS